MTDHDGHEILFKIVIFRAFFSFCPSIRLGSGTENRWNSIWTVTNVVTVNDQDRHKHNRGDLLVITTLSEPDIIKVNPAKRNRAKSVTRWSRFAGIPAKRHRAWR